MDKVNPKLIMMLAAAVIFVLVFKLTQVDAQYSTEKFWQTASVEDAHNIPQKALELGNRNGPVLMWAASVVEDPNILSVLVSRGADVVEMDPLFGATALSAAAFQNPSPYVVDALVESGAIVNESIGRLKKTPLMLAAETNDISVTERLLFHGADRTAKDVNGNTAEMIAIKFGNQAVAAFYAD